MKKLLRGKFFLILRKQIYKFDQNFFLLLGLAEDLFYYY